MNNTRSPLLAEKDSGSSMPVVMLLSRSSLKKLSNLKCLEALLTCKSWGTEWFDSFRVQVFWGPTYTPLRYTLRPTWSQLAPPKAIQYL